MREAARSDPGVADAAPADQILTAHDGRHVVTSMCLLQGESQGADWMEVARVVLHIDPRRSRTVRA